MDEYLEFCVEEGYVLFLQEFDGIDDYEFKYSKKGICCIICFYFCVLM